MSRLARAAPRRRLLLLLLLAASLPFALPWGFEYCHEGELPVLPPTAACNSTDAVWLEAAASPSLCPGSVEHGVLTLRALEAAVAACCGCHCVFPGATLPRPPSVALGWALDAAGGCWAETDSTDDCPSKFWAGRPRYGPLGVACGPPPPPRATATAVAAAAAAAAPTCDLILTPEEHPPFGYCGPRVLVAGASHCGASAVAQALFRHPAVVLRPTNVTFAPCTPGSAPGGGGGSASCSAVVADEREAGATGLPVGSHYAARVDVATGQCSALRAGGGVAVAEEPGCGRGSCRCGGGGASIHEINYFTFRTNLNYGATLDSSSLEARRAYARLLPDIAGEAGDTGGRVTLEKSTSYFGPFAPSLPAKVRALLPTAKVVVAVCDPTVRLWNQFQSQLRAEAEAAAAAAAAGPNATANAAAAGLLTLAALNVSTFADLVALFDRPRGSYETEERRLSERALTAEFLERGYYALHLLDWYTAFGRANVLAVNTDAWQRDPAAAERDARALAAFAGLAPGGLADAAATAGAAAAAGAASAAQNATAAAAAHTKRWRSAIPEAQRELLDELYTDHNFMLTKLTRIRFGSS